MPVIIISDIKEGMIDFLQSLQFEATILIDEAEKTFKKGEDDEILLRIVDGNLNAARKLYILVVNKLDINENLLGRPGRVRYVKQFGNLTEKAVNDYIDDNLKIPGKKKDILKIVDLLEISTIDILRNIVEEVNIHGDITDNNYLNIPRAKYIFDVIKFPVCSEEKVREIKEFFKKVNNINLEVWLKETHSEKNGEKITNEDWIYDKFNGYVDRLTSPYSSLWRGGETNYGEILEVDDDGFISVQFYDSEYLFKIIRQRQNPSLYRGNLVV